MMKITPAIAKITIINEPTTPKVKGIRHPTIYTKNALMRTNKQQVTIGKHETNHQNITYQANRDLPGQKCPKVVQPHETPQKNTPNQAPKQPPSQKEQPKINYRVVAIKVIGLQCHYLLLPPNIYIKQCLT